MPQLPPLFAHHSHLFESHRVNGSTYEINPYRRHSRRNSATAFTLPSRHTLFDDENDVPITLLLHGINRPMGYHERSTFNTRWCFMDSAIFSIMDPEPIPILDFNRNPPLHYSHDNHIVLSPGTGRSYQIWEERWSQQPQQQQQPQQPKPQQPQQPQQLPKFVADALIRDAIIRNAICPITHEPLTADNTAVTSCFHLFERRAITTWLETSAGSCAVCKQSTVLTTER